MKIGIVTSFNEKLYNYYAHRFLKTYNLPFNLHIYHEGWTPEDFPLRDNIHYHNLMDGKIGNHLRKFIARMGDKNINSVEPGSPDKIIHGTNYRKDAVRFSYKVFAQSDARKYSQQFFFIDADTEFLKKIPIEWFNECLPEDTLLSIYDRIGYYTEAGFVGFNNLLLNKKKQKLLDIFFNQYTNYYIYDLIYSLPAFTDCHALDATRSRFMFLKNYTEEHSNYKEKILGNWSKKQD